MLMMKVKHDKLERKSIMAKMQSVAIYLYLRTLKGDEAFVSSNDLVSQQYRQLNTQHIPR